MNKNTTTNIQLLSPFSGISCALAKVPDAAFASKMVGDGYAVDPIESKLYAPCAAKVTQIHPSRHAITLTTAIGVEVLIHIGVDTVKLKGEGFTALVNVGDEVKAKDPLIEIDLDTVANKVKSLRTVVLITDQDRIVKLTPTSANVLNAGDLLFEAEVTSSAKTVVASDDMICSDPIRIINPTGIHARPAAAIVTAIKGLNCDVMLEKAGEKANARSVVGLMGLNIGFGDNVTIWARGDDQQQALEQLTHAISTGLGEEGANASTTTPVTDDFDPFSEASLLLQTSQDPRKVSGTEASPGQVQGVLYVINSEIPKFETFAQDPQAEQQKLDDAISVANATLVQLVKDLRDKNMGQKADIFIAHQELLADPELYEKCLIELQQGKSAPYSWNKCLCRQSDKLAAMDNKLLAGRASDLIDVGNRVSRILAGLSQDTIPTDLPPNTILVSKDLSPSDTAQLNTDVVIGICTTLGVLQVTVQY
ncbi:glucose PTS transporter subunit IIA [Shewanella aestuarii]|uniref:HPr family phosphocarrier protein n=1 Tax=Shewanella aestuarii TaxID=1028752 RepID=A0A6G9QH56_9GAMM|nr:glucose PTS transporter subunit IIA [Shewanella aestuarii]QIR13397.1 HPr family phosphocarrier protein [Shewanella aestuarii]